MSYYFTITSYENNSLAWETDDVYDYSTREQAIESARYHADYWKSMFKNSSVEKTNSGAILRYDDSRGNRCRSEFTVKEK